MAMSTLFRGKHLSREGPHPWPERNPSQSGAACFSFVMQVTSLRNSSLGNYACFLTYLYCLFLWLQWPQRDLRHVASSALWDLPV